MLCVVTGAAGFIGSSICDRLLEQGHKVRAIDCFVDYYPRVIKERNLEVARSHGTFQFIEGDLLTTNLDELLEGAEWVFHQAAQAGVRSSWGDHFRTYTDNNILATQRLLEASRRHTSIKKIVYASSSSIYGNAETRPTSETITPLPISPYGVTKLAGEHLMTLYASEFGVPTASLRYFTVFGPRQRPDMAFNRFITAALRGSEITLYGDGTQSRDFTFISDIVDANLGAAKSAPVGSVYNIGGGTNATVNDVLGIIESSIGKLSVKRLERQIGDARHTSADTSKARRDLGFAPKVNLRDGIQEEIKWLRSVLSD